jgi:class 3 adenylate cyclase
MLLRNQLAYTVPNPLPLLVTLAASLGVLVTERLVRETGERERARERLGQFFAPAVVAKLLGGDDPMGRAERKVLTIMFTDVAGFTTWSSRQPPDEVRTTLNEYFGRMTTIVFEHGGTVDKYIGDGMLAFFGDPIALADDAELAVRAAIRMQEGVRELGPEIRQRNGLDLAIRIGIHRGTVVVGGIGTSLMTQYTVLGDVVNLAQRLETACTPGCVLISQEVAACLRSLRPERLALDGSRLTTVVRTVRPKGIATDVPVVEIRPEAASSERGG